MRLFAAILIITMIVTMLPATAMADDPTDISSTGLDFSLSAPDVLTTYTAGDGTVTWDPIVSDDPAEVIGGTLAFEDATIEVSSLLAAPVLAVTLPDLNGGVNVVFKGNNSIRAMDDDFATVLKCNGKMMTAPERRTPPSSTGI